jgi:hypothetical protein
MTYAKRISGSQCFISVVLSVKIALMNTFVFKRKQNTENHREKKALRTTKKEVAL